MISNDKNKGIMFRQEDFGKKEDWMSIVNTRMNKFICNRTNVWFRFKLYSKNIAMGKINKV